MTGHPLLSICIPTYNRLQYLKELLPEVLTQAECGDIEVLVSDNASTDGTVDYLRSIIHVRLRWWKNVENVGGDRNFLKCVEEARGTYIWLFGDDDILPSDSVKKVVDFLSVNSPALLISDDGRDAAPPCIYNDYPALLGARGDMLALSHTLISANIFRKDLFDMALARKMLWVQYAHMFGIMSRIKGDTVGVMPCFVKTRPIRADFAKYPSCLCVKQAVYLLFLAKKFGMPRFYCRAMFNALNLPIEYTSRIWHWLRRVFPTRFPRQAQ